MIASSLRSRSERLRAPRVSTHAMKRMRFAIPPEHAVLVFAAFGVAACSTILGIDDRTADPESGDASVVGDDAAGMQTDGSNDRTVGADALAGDGGASDSGPGDGAGPGDGPGSRPGDGALQDVSSDGSLADVHSTDAPVADAPTGVDASSTDAATLDAQTEAGSCPDPCVLATGLDFPFSLAADDSYAYWTEFGDDLGSANGSVKACPVGGCPASGPLVIALAQTNPRGVAIDSQNVYWTTASYSAVVGGIWSCPLASPGCSPTLLAAAGIPYGIAVDATYVYWTDVDDSTVHRALKAGGGVDDVLYDGGSGGFVEPKQCAVDSTTVYFIDYFADLFTLPISGGDPVTVAAGTLSGDWPVTIDPGHIYYGQAGAVFRATKAAADAGVAIGANIPEPTGLALDTDAGALYWSDWGSGAGDDGTIGKVGIDGGGKIVLAASLAYPKAIATGSAYVFWLSYGVPDSTGTQIVASTGTLLRRAK